jgi:tetratricopeptide (TPR) repeat protein
VNDWLDAEQHVEKAHEHYDAGRWEDAERELRQAISLNPYQAEWQFNLGLTLEAAGRHGEAADTFERVFQLRDQDGDRDTQAALSAGANWLRAERPAKALEWFDRARELQPRSVEVACRRIEALTALGRHEEAEEAYYLAQQEDAENADLYVSMADSLLDRGSHDRAIWCLREAGRLDPTLAGVQARLAEAYAATGRLERARQLYLRDLREDPGSVDTLLDLGDLLARMHRPDEAAEKYRRVLELEPDHPDAHFALGDLAERQGRMGDALVHFDVVLRLDPDSPAARRRLAGLLLDRGREEDLPRAVDLLRTELGVHRREPDRFDADARRELGELLLDAHLTREAVEVFRGVLALREGDHAAHHDLAVALFESGAIDEGLAQEREALVFEPRFVPAMHNLAVAHLRRNQWRRARFWTRRAAKIDPEDPGLRRLRVRLWVWWFTGLVGCLAEGVIRTPVVIWRSTLGRPSRRASTS